MSLNIERMELAIATLRDIHAHDEKHFNLAHWASNDFANHSKNERRKEVCGTVACACGWFALTPALSDQGFKLRVSYNDKNLDFVRVVVGNVAEFNAVSRKAIKLDVTGVPVFFDDNGDREYIGFEAAQHFFGISAKTSEFLFAPDDNYKTAEDVANRMAKIVARSKAARAAPKSLKKGKSK